MSELSERVRELEQKAARVDHLEEQNTRLLNHLRELNWGATDDVKHAMEQAARFGGSALTVGAFWKGWRAGEGVRPGQTFASAMKEFCPYRHDTGGCRRAWRAGLAAYWERYANRPGMTANGRR